MNNKINNRTTEFPFKVMLPLYKILLQLDEVDYMKACNLVEDLIDKAKEGERERIIKDVKYIFTRNYFKNS